MFVNTSIDVGVSWTTCSYLNKRWTLSNGRNEGNMIAYRSSPTRLPHPLDSYNIQDDQLIQQRIQQLDGL